MINKRLLEMNLTNEMGAGGKVRLLKNIAGLWLLQECRRAWALEGAEFTYEDLARQAAGAKPFVAILDPDAFLEPGDMPRRIAYSEACRPYTRGMRPEVEPEGALVMPVSSGLRMPSWTWAMAP